MVVVLCIHGWLGDNLLAQPAAELLKKENPEITKIIWYSGFPQVVPLLINNPYIDEVHVPAVPTPDPDINALVRLGVKFDKVYSTAPYTGTYPLTIEHQVNLGVKAPRLDYKVYLKDSRRVDLPLDSVLEDILKSKPTVGVCLTWKSHNREMVNSLGMLNMLKSTELFNIIPLGLLPGITQYTGATYKIVDLYESTAYLAEMCDIVVGSEGGLTNLAAGVGTTVMYTTDFTYDLAGENGSHYQIKEPLKYLGPKAYFPHGKHIALDRTKNDGEYPQLILDNLKKYFNL
jgi:hypothetical protein